MKVLILLCFVAGALASCPANSHYESCGTACPLTCKNYQDPPKACVLMCNPGCHCDKGYVKTDDGECVLPEQCPGNFNIGCRVNQRYTTCGTSCPLTCDNYQNPPKICNLMCNVGCECKEGYVKAADGSCVLPENCPSRADEQKTCLAKPDGGMCLGYFPKYYYDFQSGTCKEFIYGGCQGNGNRFSTEEECLSHCEGLRPKQSSNAVCELPAETGLCRAYIPRYHFDKASGQCKRFIYGGCGGNGNNFGTEEECNSACGNQIRSVCGANQRYTTCGTSCPLTCDNYQNPPKACNFMCNIGCECEEGYVKAADGSCVLPENCPARAEEKKTCLAKPDEGMCRGYFPMYYYDVQSGTCKEFIYGGCQGNGNRFETEEECLSHCEGLRPKQSSNAICELPSETGMCRGYFPRYHFDKASGQCKEFIYGGCGGNGNNFKTVEECNNACGNQERSVCGANQRYTTCGTSCPLTCDNYQNPPKFCNYMCNIGCECEEGYVKAADGSCVLPENCPSRALVRPDCDKAPEKGVCKAFKLRYYYDQQEAMCKLFLYGGCGGNKNNFETTDECYNRCGALASPNAACYQEKKVGPCRAAFRKYFFNKETGKCELFIYGGCQGNDNRFNTQSECESTCVA